MSRPAHSFFDRLSAELAQQKVTKAELARTVAINANTIDAWHRRGGEPSAAVLLKIARSLDVDPLWLLTGDGDRTPRALVETATDIDADIEALKSAAARSEDARRALHYLARSLRKTP